MFGSITAKKIAQNTVYQVIGKIISLLITVLATMLVARSYGRQAYGEFSLMQNWPALFFVIVDFGINAIATRELSKDWSKANEYFGSILFTRVLLSFVFMILISASLTLFPYSAQLSFGIMLSLFLILTQALFATTNIIFQVKLRYDLSTIGYVVGYCFILVLLLVLTSLKMGIVWISFSYVIGGLITFFINLGFIKNLGVTLTLRPKWSIVKYLLTESLPLGLMFVFSQINFKSDTIIMSAVKLPQRYNLNGTETVAIYSLAYKVFEVALVLPTFFMNSVYPVMVTHMQESEQRLKNTFTKSLVFLTVFAIFSSITGILFSPLVIKILGGSDFPYSSLILQILLGGLVFYFLTQPLSWLLVTLGKQKTLPLIYFTSALFNVLCNYFLIPRYSFLASAFITHASELLILIMLLIVVKKAWAEKYV